MGQDVEGMGYGERVICFSLFICLAVAVFSTVSLIYLTSIVYVPVQNELEAGFITEPVMCTSLKAEKVCCHLVILSLTGIMDFRQTVPQNGCLAMNGAFRTLVAIALKFGLKFEKMEPMFDSQIVKMFVTV